MLNKGLFISFEGSDGSGKSTQISLLKDFYEKQGREVVLTREPGGTPISEKIRNILLDTNHMEMNPIAEALLYAAARAQHVNQVIKTSIEKGMIVISDRYIDSSVVYQGYARNLGMDTIRKLNEWATNNLYPDITFYLHLHGEESLKRLSKTREYDRIEKEGASFQEKVNKGYLQLANDEPNRIYIIDAKKSIEEVHGAIVKVLPKEK